LFGKRPEQCRYNFAYCFPGEVVAHEFRGLANEMGLITFVSPAQAVNPSPLPPTKDIYLLYLGLDSYFDITDGGPEFNGL
jgi:hypothetical protein